jgi:hypothetical protein
MAVRRNDELRTTNDERKMRIAWFSPLPPTRSGVAAYTADAVAALSHAHAID